MKILQIMFTGHPYTFSIEFKSTVFTGHGKVTVAIAILFSTKYYRSA